MTTCKLILATAMVGLMANMANADLNSALNGNSFVLKGANGYASKKNYVHDLETKYIYTSTSFEAHWKFKKLANGWYNIVSVKRSSGCIYDSSSSSLAKFDRSCNSNEPRAEWLAERFGTGDFQRPAYIIKNRKGRCLEVDTTRERLKAVTCNNNFEQQFEFL
jgi:hypothetical protein